ncbi:hypothetical protein HHTV1_18 [Haloarcula hispanica tailed virus 1]|uniref:Uncharacterized protein n=1 Tax=Haloarcula hispanica tailed virus 1 TaxID=1273750 RepID=R4T6F1_9CAUD|nr:hypothetical protein M198_gp18 [Haloarcula hispanica tailed virus 1]AGM11274.1 hypothetical protein HHTV1_18 [Haloarcula hispanica tailed virus 1]
MAGKNPIQQLDRVVSAQILGMFLLGKFIGDYAAIQITDVLGQDTGYVVGIAFSLLFVLFWPTIERRYEQWKDQNGSD